jgi:hypothetical protein
MTSQVLLSWVCYKLGKELLIINIDYFHMEIYSERHYTQFVVYGTGKVYSPRFGCVEDWQRRMR